jgi:cytidyltransferase-like protein
MSAKRIMVSGGFDPIHIGHVRMIQEAAKHGPVVVAVNSDDWLMRKKGYVFMPWTERAEIVESIKGVKYAVAVNDSDDTVCDAIKEEHPHAFANGGDRKGDNTPEVALCNEMGIELIWNIGGGKIQSSSDLVAASKK